MYRILLADDEGIMLMSLRKMIETNFPDQFEIETAKTGNTAVSLADEFRPDIIFMDIHMPGMNGIDAIKEIKEKHENTLFVVITAYDKFDYAKEALSLNVFEFVMKPVSKQVIIDLCRKAIDKLEEDRKNKLDALRIKEKLDTVIPILESGFIHNVILQEASAAEIEHYRELLDIEQRYGYIILLQFGEESVDGVLTNPVGMGMRAQKFYDKLRETVGEYFDGLISPIISNKITILVPCDEEILSYDERVKIIDQARMMRKSLTEVFEAKYRIGIGTPKEFAALSQSYREAGKALADEKSRVAHYADLPENQAVYEQYPIQLEQQFYDVIERGEVSSAQECIAAILRWMQQEGKQNLNGIRLKMLELIVTAEKSAFHKGFAGYDFSSYQNYLEEILQCNDGKQILSWINVKIAALCHAMAEHTESDSAVERAIQYIDQNYAKDISLNDVSELVNISPYYFSKLFKEEAGVNFIDYLTNVRIEKAKELLRIPDKSIKEICILSGYGNANYFSRIFKKVEGVTPTEYRERYRL